MFLGDSGPQTAVGTKATNWKAGDHCRAHHKEEAYEATILEVLPEKKLARVEFYGFGNVESICLEDIFASKGDDARKRQITEIVTASCSPLCISEKLLPEGKDLVCQTLPITSITNQPAEAEPKKPVEPEPKKPFEPEPKKPAADEPKKPLGAVPKKPLEAEPKKTVGSEPKKPVGSEPKKPVEAEPKKTDGAEPKKPAATTIEPATLSPTSGAPLICEQGRAISEAPGKSPIPVATIAERTKTIEASPLTVAGSISTESATRSRAREIQKVEAIMARADSVIQTDSSHISMISLQRALSSTPKKVNLQTILRNKEELKQRSFSGVCSR